MVRREQTRSRYPAVVVLALLALVASLSVSSASAQAAGWYKNGKPFSGTEAFAGWNIHQLEFTIQYGQSFAFVADCEATVDFPASLISEGVFLNMGWKLSGCHFIDPEMGKKCVVTSAPTHLSYQGTGASGAVTQTGEWLKLKGGLACPLPLERKLIFNSPFSFTYGVEATHLVMKSTGTAKFGDGSATTTVSTEGLGILQSVSYWGWH